MQEHDDEGNANAKLDSDATALAKYSAVMSYLQYENTVYWTRAGLVVAAQGALLGFSASLFLEAFAKATGPALSLAIAVALLGGFFCLIGIMMNNGGLRWIRRWERICRDLEPQAFGATEVLRNPEKPEPGTNNRSVRALANVLLYVLLATWILAVGALVGSLAWRPGTTVLANTVSTAGGAVVQESGRDGRIDLAVSVPASPSSSASADISVSPIGK